MPKSSKKVVAIFTGKGFKIKGEKISHNSSVLYKDKDYYLGDEAESIISDMLGAFSRGVTAALENKRIKPGSLRITFQILEK